MNHKKYNKHLLDFIKNSPTPFHVVANMQESLDAAGFQHLKEEERWQLINGNGYYVTRNDSSIIVFIFGMKPSVETGIRLVGGHTDSPCLKIKPQPEVYKNSYYQLGVEVYGGALLGPWFDRDLSIAGKVSYQTEKGKLQESLIDMKRPVGIIPSLAIHLDRDANNNRSIDPQTDMLPILYKCGNTREDFRSILAKELPPSAHSGSVSILDYDLYFYDCQLPALIGLKEDFISSARLDNLLSCFAGLQALLNSNKQITSVLACYDHEEVGSTSAIGANGSFLESLLDRIYSEPEEKSRVMAQSILISTDNAHGIHPNFPSKHDENHAPVINEGLVIKVNANQRYATNSTTSSFLKNLCKEISVPTQYFVSRAGIPCGSTIGPITAANIGVKTIDVGVPTFAMHSIRELAGANDAYYLFQTLSAFLDIEKL